MISVYEVRVLVQRGVWGRRIQGLLRSMEMVALGWNIFTFVSDLMYLTLPFYQSSRSTL